MADVDVVVIGAGAAGVGAGLALKARGLSFVILEAAGRIGGRAYTDRQSMPFAWDQGCHWLHCADVNPLVAFADRLGSTYANQVETLDSYRQFYRGRWADAAECKAVGDAIDLAFSTVYEVSQQGRDVPISDVLPDLGTSAGYVRNILQLMASADPEDESTSGYADYEDTETNWPVTSGYGDLIERMAQGLPIRTGVTVRAVTEADGGVRVETEDGVVSARAAVVTVSNNVLLSGAIRIDVPDARPVLDVVESMPCGSYEKVCIGLRRPLPGMDKTLFFNVEPEGGIPANFQVPTWLPTSLIMHLGGSVAKEVGGQGAGALTSFATERLKLAFGADIEAEITATATTGWEKNPLILGAYSAPRPGQAQKRRDAIATHTGRIGFAGEAFSLKWEATAHGAYQSGQDVVARLVREEL